MSDMLQTEIHLMNNGIKFSSQSGDNPAIISDYYPPLGNNEGYKPLELFLISFGTCVSGTVLPLLRRMQKSIESYSMKVEGTRKTEHPTGFSKIILNITVQSPDISTEDLQKAVTLAEQKFCPVWSMIKNNVLVETEFHIDR
jgi:putative redox protein